MAFSKSMVNICFVIFFQREGREVRQEKRNLWVLCGLRGSFSDLEKTMLDWFTETFGTFFRCGIKDFCKRSGITQYEDEFRDILRS